MLHECPSHGLRVLCEGCERLPSETPSAVTVCDSTTLAAVTRFSAEVRAFLTVVTVVTVILGKRENKTQLQKFIALSTVTTVIRTVPDHR